VSATFFARAKGFFGSPEPSADAPGPGKATPTVRKLDTSFHAVSIVPGHQCCAAARQLKKARFLSREAPKVPLKDCDRGGECTCRYEHYQDRRKGSRRARDMGVAIDGWVEEDRREAKGRGRRKSEHRE
jgi:hypothetical protein